MVGRDITHCDKYSPWNLKQGSMAGVDVKFERYQLMSSRLTCTAASSSASCRAVHPSQASLFLQICDWNTESYSAEIGMGGDMATMSHSDFKCPIGKGLVQTVSHYLIETWRQKTVHDESTRVLSHWKFSEGDNVSYKLKSIMISAALHCQA